MPKISSFEAVVAVRSDMNAYEGMLWNRILLAMQTQTLVGIAIECSLKLTLPHHKKRPVHRLFVDCDSFPNDRRAQSLRDGEFACDFAIAGCRSLWNRT